MAAAGFSSGGAAVRYVLPVLWMTSRLGVVNGDAWKSEPLTYTTRVAAIPGRSLMSTNALFIRVINVFTSVRYVHSPDTETTTCQRNISCAF